MGDRPWLGTGPRWSRLLRRHRRLLAGAAAAASIGALGLALQAPAAPTRPVVVAARDLPAGALLAVTDVAVASVPAGVLPASTFTDAGHVVGEVLAAPLQRGEAVGAHRLSAPPDWALPPGTMPLPVRFTDDGAADLLSAGVRVDVLASPGPGLDEGSGSAGAHLVATDVLVLAVVRPDAAAAGFLGSGAAGDESDTLVVLAVDSSQALAVSGAQARATLAYTLRPHAAGP